MANLLFNVVEVLWVIKVVYGGIEIPIQFRKVGNIIMFLCNYIIHISFLLLFIYDQKLYNTLLCKRKKENDTDYMYISFQDLFIP